MISQLPAEDVAYDVVAGVTGGAVNAALLSNYEKGQESEATTHMRDFWIRSAKTKLR